MPFFFALRFYNVLHLFRIVMDRHQLSKGKPPLIKGSLVEWPINN
jgi:hypothetical protein